MKKIILLCSVVLMAAATFGRGTPVKYPKRANDAVNVLNIKDVSEIGESVHVIIAGQSLACGFSDDGAGNLSGEYLSGMEDCFQSVFTRAPGTGLTEVRLNEVGPTKIINPQYWSAEIGISRQLRDALGVNVYVTRAGKGGAAVTEFSEVHPESLWPDIVAAESAMMTTYPECPEPQFFIWLQGENEVVSDYKSSFYAANQLIVMDQVLAAWPDIKIIIAGQNGEYEQQPYFDRVQGVKIDYCATNSHAVYVPCLDVTHPVGDGHPNSIGNLEMGAKFAAAILGFGTDKELKNGIRSGYVSARNVSSERIISGAIAANTVTAESAKMANIDSVTLSDKFGAIRSKHIPSTALAWYMRFSNQSVSNEVINGNFEASGMTFSMDPDPSRNYVANDESFRNSSYYLTDIRTANMTVSMFVKFSDPTIYGNLFAFPAAEGGDAYMKLSSIYNGGFSEGIVLSWGGSFETVPYHFQSDLWYHIALSSIDDIARIYVNGTEISSTDVSANSQTPDGYLYIFNDPAQGSDDTTGFLDDLMVWERGLSAAEVSGLAGNQYQGLTGLIEQ